MVADGYIGRMSDAALRALRTAIAKRQPLDRVYYLHGDDDHRKEQIVHALIEAVLEPGVRDFNLDVRRGAEVEPAGLAAMLDALPMLAARRVAVLREVDALKKPARMVLDRYLERPSEDTLLVLVAPGGEKPDAGLVKRCTAVAVAALTEEEVAHWVTQQATRAGATITPEAAALVAAATGPDLALAAGELDKLISYVQGGPITPEAVDAVTGVRRGETLGDLLDAVLQRDVRRAVALVGPVLALPKVEAVPVVLALSAQTLALAWAKAKGGRVDFFGFLKTGKAFTGRPWGECVTAWTAALPKWSTEDLTRALRLLHAADKALKDTRVSSDEAMITSLVLALATPARSRRAA
jgi:DNA polymerase III subunit delta